MLAYQPLCNRNMVLQVHLIELACLQPWHFAMITRGELLCHSVCLSTAVPRAEDHNLNLQSSHVIACLQLFYCQRTNK